MQLFTKLDMLSSVKLKRRYICLKNNTLQQFKHKDKCDIYPSELGISIFN